jgi:transposase
MFFDELSNDEWALLAALVSDEPAVRLNRRGRPRAEPRVVANAVLWILTTGEPWSKLPGRYPSGPTCRRRFEEWQLNGTLAEMIRLLSQTGRTFVYVPQAPQPVAAKPAVQPEVVSVREDSLRGVCWKSPESWQTPAGVTNGLRSLDPLADMTRQLSGTLPHEAPRVERSVSRAVEPGGVTPHRDHPRSPLPMSVAARGTQVVDRRGYVIYVAAERVPKAMYRAWAEIEQDGRRVERSGLVGPRFANPDEAQEYALEWARQWIDRQCRMLSAVPNASAPGGYARPLPGIRTMPNAPTVSSAGVRADGSGSAQMSGQAGGQLSGQTGGHVSGQTAGQASGHLAKPMSGPMSGALTGPHGPANALRAPLRRYPGEATTDNTAERFPTASELISHAG